VTRLAIIGAVVVALFAPAATADAPARVGVSATEFRFSLSRTSLKRGAAIIELDNFGQDVHDLRLRRVGGTRTYALPETKPGERSELGLRLAPGRYRLWCATGDHSARGMRAAFRVR
jgi:hypothetical protein